jgi:hypothetical protein
LLFSYQKSFFFYCPFSLCIGSGIDSANLKTPAVSYKLRSRSVENNNEKPVQQIKTPLGIENQIMAEGPAKYIYADLESQRA